MFKYNLTKPVVCRYVDNHELGFSVGNLTLQQVFLLFQPSNVHNIPCVYSDEGHSIVVETSVKGFIVNISWLE